MRRLSAGLALLLWLAPVLISARAEGLSPTWTERFDRIEIAATAIDPAGNVYVAGNKRSNDAAPWRVAYLAKYGPAGAKLWSRTWVPEGLVGWTGATEVAVGADGAVYWAGVAAGRCEGGGWFVRKSTPQGRLLWHRDQDGWKHCETATTTTDIAVGQGLVAVSMFDHGCCGDPSADGYVLAFRLDGSLRWRAPFEPPDVWRGFFDQATGVAVGGFDNVYVVGWGATKKIAWDEPLPYPGIAALEKVSAGGAVLWARPIPVAGPADWPADVAVRGNAVMTTGDTGGIGISWSWGPPPSGWLTRLSAGGQLVWTRTWGEQPRGADPVAVAIDPAGASWVLGTARDPRDRGLDVFVRRYSQSGGLMWTRVLNGPVLRLSARDIAATSGVLAIAGHAATSNAHDQEWGVVYRWAR